MSTIVIVDDHAGFRASARALLAANGFEVVGEAADGASALAEIRRLRPRAVLLDVHLPDLDGFEVARRMLEEDDPPAVVLTSSRAAGYYRRRALAMALAFVEKADLASAGIAALRG